LKVRPKKRLSQNFLVDDDAARRIVDSLDLDWEDVVLEIGAGKGALTGYLLDKAKEIVAVEIDGRLCNYLGRKFRGRDNLRIVHGDILKADFTTLFTPPLKYKVVGNLPYKITSPVLDLLLDQRDRIVLSVLMVQQEVAQRICANPGSRHWSPLSIAIQLHSQAEILFHLKPSSFFPPPRVRSSVIRLAFLSRQRVLIPDEKAFFRIVRAAFALRRKTLLNSLAVNLHLPKPELEPILKKTGIDLLSRAEALTLSQYADLTAALGGQAK
jgi:16S rRNA (adenine1518-N6/adenine1519-N6)-dimethyltransferase